MWITYKTYHKNCHELGSFPLSFHVFPHHIIILFAIGPAWCKFLLCRTLICCWWWQG